MPIFPQPVYKFSTGLDANTTANPGDSLEFAPTANRVVTLPAVTTGGPVLVKLNGTFGAGFTVKIVPSDSATIDGLGSLILVNAGDLVTLASDGTNWWVIGGKHNTHDSW